MQKNVQDLDTGKKQTDSGKRGTVDLGTRRKAASRGGSDKKIETKKPKLEDESHEHEPLETETYRRRQGLFITGGVSGTDIQFLVDTDATDTVMSRAAFYMIPRVSRPKLWPAGDLLVRQVNGAPVRSIWGTINIDIQIGRTKIPVRAVVTDMDVPAILGMDFPLRSQGGLNLRTLELIMNGKRYQCSDHLGSAFCHRVVVEKTTTIPPGHEAIIPAYIKSNKTIVNLGIIEPVKGGGEVTSGGLVLARTLETIWTRPSPSKSF